MTIRRTALIVCVATLSGCASARRNADCQFPLDGIPPRGGLVDQTALDRDALLAEDLAIRFADRTAGRRSGWPRGRDGYRATRDQCMATLFEVVGRRHGVTSKQVREAASHRSWTFDVLTLGSLAAWFALVSAQVIRRILSGPLADSRPALVLALAFASIALAIVGFGAGNVWSGIAETLRLGNGHGSYRVERIPLRQHPLSMFTAAVVLFWLMAAYHFWTTTRSDA